MSQSSIPLLEQAGTELQPVLLEWQDQRARMRRPAFVLVLTFMTSSFVLSEDNLRKEGSLSRRIAECQ